MKTFKDYLFESKKVYSFKVKVAGDLPENFQNDLKKSLEKHQVITLEKMTTPVQESPLDFPELANREVNIFDVVVEYPITAPEIASFLKEMGVAEDCFRVRNSAEPSETDVRITNDEAGALLDDAQYLEAVEVKAKDYFGDEFNKSFLKDLAQTAKEKSKELGHDKLDANVLAANQKKEFDKAGMKSPMGS